MVILKGSPKPFAFVEWKRFADACRPNKDGIHIGPYFTAIGFNPDLAFKCARNCGHSSPFLEKTRDTEALSEINEGVDPRS
jgi:hypothetical protein